MSGIYLSGIEMPQSCHECPFLYVTSICDGSKNCPLLPVPPHGRLIDADKLTLTDIDIALCEDYKSLLSLYINKVENAPTIIEAEDGTK